MAIVKTVLFVLFIILCVFLILMVLVQNEDRNGMGGVFGGGQSAAFGSHSASVLTKTTGVFAALFFIFAFTLALLNKAGDSGKDLGKTAAEVQETTVDSNASGSWLDKLED